jgi:hypothetical protein
MKPKQKSRRGLGLDSGLDLAISRFMHSLAGTVLLQKIFSQGETIHKQPSK